MSSRRVTDEKGRVWECKPESEAGPGCDVTLLCTTPDLSAPLRVKVSWQWASINEKGLARMIVAAAPGFVPSEKSLPPTMQKTVRKAKRGAKGA